MEILGSIAFLMAHFPLSWDQIVALAIGCKMLIDAFKNKQWDKARQIAYDTALPLVTEVLDNKDKRDAVIASVWANMPRSLRAFATAEQVEAMVDSVYVNRVKPEAGRLNLTKGKPEQTQP